MFKELAILSEIVQQKLTPQNGPNISPELLEEWLNTVLEEEQKIKYKIAESVLQLPNETHIQVYISNYQLRLTALANQLYNCINDLQPNFDAHDNEKLSLQKLRRFAYQSIENQIDYLRTHFVAFFLFDERPPQRQVVFATMQFSQNIIDLHDLNEHDDKYISILISTLSYYIQNPEKLSFHKIEYFKKFLSEIFYNNLQSIESIKQKSFYMNFNCEAFAEELTSEYKNELEKITDIRQRVDKLAFYLKHITQMPSQKEYVYNKNQRSLTDQISTWIIEEMSYLEKKLILSNIRIPIDNSLMGTNYKVQTSLSVPQLAYFLKLLVELEIIKYPNDKELLKFYAEHTSTKKTESISAESLRVKFYNIEDNTREEVKSVIIRVLNHIQSKLNK